MRASADIHLIYTLDVELRNEAAVANVDERNVGPTPIPATSSSRRRRPG